MNSEQLPAASSGIFYVRQISTEEAIPLRHEVLRPGRPRATAYFAGDDLPTTTHWGACSPQGDILAIATLMRSPKPGQPELGMSGEGPLAWQVRGMASSPRARGKGYGSAVLRAVVDYVRSQSPDGVLWCNARMIALEFYRAHGFVTEGPQFEIAGLGPHFVMVYGT